MDLTTSARVKEMLDSGGISVGSAIDTLITQMISTYSQNVERFLGRHVESTSRTEQYDIEVGQRFFHLPGSPISSITSVKAADDRDFASADAIDTDNYYADLARGSIEFDTSPSAVGPGTLQIIYEGGMAANTAAFIAAYPDVAQACDMQIAYVISRKDQLGAQSIGMQSGSIGWSGPVDMLPEVKRILEPYRRLL